ncbi:MAG: hypothetical protein AAGF57_01840 [Pseudomonadota bacterium]
MPICTTDRSCGYDVSGAIAAPHAGGPVYAALTDDTKQRWEQAAKVVNQKLGHGDQREDITATCVGAR